jgi:hypothetical protein
MGNNLSRWLSFLTLCELTSSYVEVRKCQQGQQEGNILSSIRHGGRACVTSLSGTRRRGRDGMIRVC